LQFPAPPPETCLEETLVTRGQLPQRAGLPGLNGGGAAAAVPPGPILGLLIRFGGFKVLIKVLDGMFNECF